jgi:hypothetical protein
MFLKVRFALYAAVVEVGLIYRMVTLVGRAADRLGA